MSNHPHLSAHTDPTVLSNFRAQNCFEKHREYTSQSVGSSRILVQRVGGLTNVTMSAKIIQRYSEPQLEVE